MIRVWRFFSTALNNFNLYFYLYFFKWIFWSHIFSILQLFGLLGLFQRSSAPYFRICQSECIDLSISPNIFAFYFCEMNTFPYLLNFTYPLCLPSKLFLYCSTTVRLFFFCLAPPRYATKIFIHREWSLFATGYPLKASIVYPFNKYHFACHKYRASIADRKFCVLKIITLQ